MISWNDKYSVSLTTALSLRFQRQDRTAKKRGFLPCSRLWRRAGQVRRSTLYICILHGIAYKEFPPPLFIRPVYAERFPAILVHAGSTPAACIPPGRQKEKSTARQNI
jgi:hypothetical protein